MTVLETEGETDMNYTPLVRYVIAMHFAITYLTASVGLAWAVREFFPDARQRVWSVERLHS